MRNIYLFILCIVGLSCGHTHYCYVVRHAEKLDNTPYSVLSPVGHQTAIRLKDRLQDKKIDLVFATTFQRTQETAQPLATAFNKELLIYRNNAVDSIATVVKNNSNKNSVLVGHSGNIPAIIEKVTGQKVAAIKEDQYDKLYIIQFKKGKMTLQETRY
jgi:broad specificity phosphatase PhoE